MTLYKAIVLPRPNGVNILTVLLRDGTIYFGVMVVSNLANVLTFMLGGSLTRGAATTFSNVMASVMISRLMLNLRDPSLLINGGHTTTVELTYPNLTLSESEYLPYISEEASCSRVVPSQPGPFPAIYH
ncbi:hypothetical protein M413DRAFT_448092 [Hebeloma cylindrosporum]|uniref:Uncharacterized protein n=1 Tax=Hebeloma cylindrosporum TaxID=76867 RepID=A0A0C2XJZ1_HEBCY|nr:hypothetical protein M413DRAFT_448092 [Hebeloma cylindrosporum h7]